MEKSYWNGKSQFQDFVIELQKLVPASGSISGKKNAKLERFRKAMNCYYDLYNNGLGNRARSFASVFGFAAGRYRFTNMHYGKEYADRLYELTESVMDDIVLAAYVEQFPNK